MEISKSIFREYDIRGVYPDTLNENTALMIGKAIGHDFHQRGYLNIAVGIDNRASSPALSLKLIEGLLGTGRNVTFLGITTTPMVYFFSCDKRFDAGIAVTASHNPKDQNGFKISLKNGDACAGKDIFNYWNIINEGVFTKGTGVYKEENLSLDYIEYMKKSFSFRKKMKVALGCGNGATSEIAPKIFQELGMNVIPILCQYDSSFPFGVPDPEKQSFLELVRKDVLKEKADVGFGFDADGDRIGLVDEKGGFHTVDRVTMLLAKYVLKENPGAKVVYDVKCSKNLERFILKYGGVPEMMRTGHSYFVKRTITGEALLGGEFSGHIFFADRYFGFDDAIYSACRILEIMDYENTPLSILMSEFPITSSSPEVKLNCPDDKKTVIVERIKEEVAKNNKFKNLITLDGIRADYMDFGWFLIRASNTSAYLSVRFEADSQTKLSIIGKELVALLSDYSDLDILPLKNFIG